MSERAVFRYRRPDNSNRIIQKGEGMRVLVRIVSVIVAVCVPAVAVFSASNLVFRLPDLYVYEFNSIEIADEIDLGITDDELGHFFSDFMKGNKEEFDLFTKYRDREQAVFGPVEQLNMENARDLLNHTIYILGVSALLLIASYWILLAKRKKSRLRTAFKGGIVVFAVLQVLLYVLFYYNNSRSFFYSQIFINPYGADDVLPLLLTEHFSKLCMLTNSIAAIVILLIFTSITWRLTKPRRMFW